MKLVLTAFLPFALGYFLSFLFRSLNAVVAPSLRGELGLDDASIGVITSAYLAAFAIAQLPAGVALDRFGPRRVAPFMLVFAAVGAVVFALAHDAWMLALGRALIGFGVSVALMCGFKANVLYWPLPRLSLVNSIMMTFGGLGAAMATRPVQWLLADCDWRLVFVGLAAVTLAVAFYQAAAAPRFERGGQARLRDELRGLADIVRRRLFWQAGLAPATSFGAWISYTSFWSAGWLRDVARLDEASVGVVLFALSLAIMPGYFLSGVVADLLQRAGIAGGKVLLAYGAGFLLVNLLIASNYAALPTLLWFAYALSGGTLVVVFALITRAFPMELAGRVNTTLNLVSIIAAFAVQAAVGPVLVWLQSRGLARAEAHQVVMLVLFGLQALSWGWFAMSREARELR